MEHSIDDLRTVVRTCPVVDNHAHNLLRPHGLRSTDFLTITTEATGEALEDTPKSLAHIRAAKQLRTLYDLPPAADWETILKERNRLLYEDADGLTRKCLEGMQTILIDDGLGSPDAFEPYQWHSKFTLSPCKRIVRIEAVAAAVLASLHQQWKLPVGISIADDEACSLAWVKFITAFEQAIALAISDPDVVGFKSVICYRAGLSVRTGRDSEVTDAGLRSFTHEFLPTCEARGFRVEGRGMCDALVISACKLIAAGFSERGRAKPLQFHTGLGDNDISLLGSNPGGLQSLIEAFPTVPIVLLHSAYPYTREAGYLATVYKNVYLDIGEVFPMVSRGGQEAIVRQAVELTPISKVLWSTDGHLQAETYWLANVQGRQAIERVFVELVEEGDLSVEQAIEAVEGILFNNSNVLYELGLRLPRTLDVAVGGTANTPMPSQQIQTAATVTAPIHDFSFIFVQWLDWMGMLRNRCIPGHKNLQPDQLSFGISRGNLGTLQNDSFTPVCNPVGQIYVRPDLDSLRPMYQGNLPGPAATIMASFEDETGQPLDLCPRSLLAETVTTLRSQHSLDLLLGFEVEITFCQRNPPSSSSTTDPYSPLDTNHAWSTLSDTQYTTSLPLLLSITQALAAANLPITHLHSESGPGQYEFVLPPLPPVRAIDTLVQTRQAIQQIAATHRLRATVHPQPFPGAGTACHANLSFRRASASGNVNQVPELEAQQSHFFAGVLARLRGLCAFTMPQGASYARVADDAWACGRWVAWGTQNREVPLRRVAGAAARWEVRCLDGTGNAYLAVAAVLRAGLGGLREGREMGVRECLVNPSGLTEGEREGLGIGERLPGSLGEALEALEGDEGLREAVGVEVVGHYVAMKKAEQEMLGGMEEGERRVWLMERY